VTDQPEASEPFDISRYRLDDQGRRVAYTPARRAGAPPAIRGRSREVPGLPGWAAVVLLLVIAGIGGVIDQINGASVQGAFNWALILASVVAILAVKRSQMFSVVIAPPLVYFIASAGKLYFSSNGLKDRAALTNAAANWLVYGFPAIAGATALVLLIAGIRMIVRR
jgi:hypothetical protein